MLEYYFDVSVDCGFIIRDFGVFIVDVNFVVVSFVEVVED